MKGIFRNTKRVVAVGASPGRREPSNYLRAFARNVRLENTLTMANQHQAKQLRDAVRHLVVAHGVLNATQRPCGAPLAVPHAYALLELLSAPAGLTTTELATRLSIDRTNVSRLVGKMERDGEVRRRIDSEDARAKQVTLTPRGKRIARGVDASSASHFARLADSLSLPVKTVVEALTSLEKVMTEEQPNPTEEYA